MSFGERLVVVPFGTPVSVSVPTTLIPFTTWGDRTGQLLFALVNQGADSATMVLETSEDGVTPDYGKKIEILVPAGTQGSHEESEPLRTFWRLSAHTAGPVVPVIFQVTFRHYYK